MGVNSKGRVQINASVIAMKLTFVLLGFENEDVRRRAKCTRWSVDMQQFREINVTRTI